MRIVVIVSADPSDIYFANQLAQRTNVVGVFVESRQRRLPAGERWRSIAAGYALRPGALLRKIREILSHRRYERMARAILRKGFGTESGRLWVSGGCAVVHVEGRGINESRYTGQIKALKPDLIAVCGASLLRTPILSIPPRGTLNLHGGLSQRYRGEWPTLWAIYNEEPEYIGYTVHFVSEGIDDGDIVSQGRCPIDEDDNQETLYVKVVKAGTEAMIEAIRAVEDGTVQRYPLSRKGTFYPRSKVTPDIIRATWEKVRSGVIKRYLRQPRSVETIGGERVPFRIPAAGAGNERRACGTTTTVS